LRRRRRNIEEREGIVDVGEEDVKEQSTEMRRESRLRRKNVKG
jgi:hypothetical protein